MQHILPWFSDNRFPLFLAPMAGVSDKIFRQLCKARGADVLTTEFVSSEGIFRRNDRTREYLDFDEVERPIGVQLFGGDPDHMAEAARQVIDWVRPDFIDLNFGCPVNKVVSKNGGSALLKDCPALAAVADAVVRAVAPMPVTAKIRIGWDANSINAPQVARILEDLRIAVDRRPWSHARARLFRRRGLERNRRGCRRGHSSGRRQRRSDDCGGCRATTRRDRNRRGDDRSSGHEFAMDFSARSKITSPPASVRSAAGAAEKWALIQRHCQLAVEEWRSEEQAIRSMRAADGLLQRFPGSKALREKFQHVSVCRSRRDRGAASGAGKLQCRPAPIDLTYAVTRNFNSRYTALNYKIGNERLIKVTENASRKLNSLLEKQGRAHGALRVAVIGGGCSGLQYKMDLVDGPANRDIFGAVRRTCGWWSIRRARFLSAVRSGLQRRFAERRIQSDESECGRALFLRRKFRCMTDYFALLDRAASTVARPDELKQKYHRTDVGHAS